ncbi:deoxycytidyl transferase [Tulasnella sp. JGI-2019a]|nr:deoxycytidyl transferase [Tulasnella sp. JGI-2019a]
MESSTARAFFFPIPATTTTCVCCSMSSDADLWGSQEDSEFLDALANSSLPVPPESVITAAEAGTDNPGVHLKRKRTPSSPSLPPVISTSDAYDIDLDNAHLPMEDDDEDPDVNPALFTRQRRPTPERPNAQNESYVYGAANFGGFGEYMFRKRAKLQFQNQDLSNEGESKGAGRNRTIFKGVAIYVNGFTDPPFQVLREMLMAHGGIFHAYLDKKSLVTHIVASQLTPAKIMEYQKGKMKVVTPEWIVKSVEAGALLRWQDFALKPGTGSIAAHGKGTAFAGTDGAGPDVDQSANMSAKPSQKTLLDVLVSQHPQRKSKTPGVPGAQKPPSSFRQVLSSSSSSSQSQKGTKSVIALAGAKAVAENAPRVGKDSSSFDPPPAHSDLTSGNRGGKQATDSTSKEAAVRTPGPTEQTIVQPPFLTTTSPTPTRTLHDTSRLETMVSMMDGPHSLVERPRYALHDSNPFAAKLMQSTQWRNEHTSANATGFVESYYQNSRLHHLSSWKSELKKLVAEARERAENGDGDADGMGMLEMDVGVSMQGVKLDGLASHAQTKDKGKEKAKEALGRVIMHCDFDSFFVAAGSVDRPELKGKPVVVCHSGKEGGKASTSEIASAGYEARKFGVKNGMSLGQARQLCPNIIPIPYEFEKYKQFSLQFYTILMSFADDLQAVSVDEALIDVSQRVAQAKADAVDIDRDATPRDFAKQLAEQIRDKIREITSCEVSIGISHNILLARMATRKAKPAGSYHLLLEDVPAHLAPLGITAIHGVGWSIRDKIKDKFNVETLGELLPKSKQSLQRVLGEKTGDKIWKAVRGVDDTPLESDKPRKSVSAEVNYGIRFENEKQAETFMYTLSIEVSKRLKAINRKGGLLTLKVMTRNADAPKEAPKFMGHGKVDTYSKSMAIAEPGSGGPTDDPKAIGDATWTLLKSFRFDPSELRGIGIQIQKLDDGDETTAKLDAGQSRLPFIKATGDGQVSKGKGKEKAIDGDVDADPFLPEVGVGGPLKPSRSDAGRLELPSASQIDSSVLESLPEDLKREILAGLAGTAGQATVDVGADTHIYNAASGPCHRRVRGPSPSPAVGDDDDIIELGDDEVAALISRTTGSLDHSRSQSVPVPRRIISRATTLEPARTSAVVKATSVSPTKTTAAARLASIKHITKQFAPKRKPPMFSPTKISLFKSKARHAADVDDDQLRDLGVDPMCFRELPADIQKEQLVILLQNLPGSAVDLLAVRGALLPVPDDLQRPGSRGSSRSRSPYTELPHEYTDDTRNHPIPVASYTSQPYIKKLTEVNDVQDMLKQWIQYRLEEGPIAAEVNRMATFLVKCAETDVGLEKVVSVMRFWRLLLRNHWPQFERDDEDQAASGALWWKAFRETKISVDGPIKKRFGCRLGLGR